MIGSQVIFFILEYLHSYFIPNISPVIIKMLFQDSNKNDENTLLKLVPYFIIALQSKLGNLHNGSFCTNSWGAGQGTGECKTGHFDN